MPKLALAIIIGVADMTKKPDKPEVTFIDNPHAPEIFSDEATGIFFFGGCIRLTFEGLRVNHITSPGPVNRVVNGRVVMPLGAAERLRDMLVEYLGKINSEAGNPPSQGSRTLQ
jgi:hypothetical protein